jgi:hypothetical protein
MHIRLLATEPSYNELCHIPVSFHTAYSLRSIFIVAGRPDGVHEFLNCSECRFFRIKFLYFFEKTTLLILITHHRGGSANKDLSLVYDCTIRLSDTN